MVLRTRSNKTSQTVRLLLVIAPVLFILGYLYWWLTRPAEKRLDSVEIEIPPPTRVPLITKHDDLKKIKGIGPIISEVLRSQRIFFFHQIALISEDDLRECVSGAGIRLTNLSTWSEQARLAALEEWEKLRELQASI